MGLLRRASDLLDRAGDALITRDVEPLEGTNISLFNTIIPSWWQDNINDSGWRIPSPRLAERVWVASRCIQLNAQQIASMPIKFVGAPSSTEPNWLSNPDPTWYPNGINDALFSVVRSIYSRGYALIFVTERYADGFPHSWTVLDPDGVEIVLRDGERAYKVNDEFLVSDDVVQIDRNPSAALHGSSPIRAFYAQAWGLLAAQQQAQSVNSGAVPQSVLKSKRKLTEAQAQKIQTQWGDAVSNRGGLPPVLPPELDFEQNSFSPADLALLETQEFNALALASAYGVPAFLLNLSLKGGLTYQNPGMLGEMWWRFELRPRSTSIANAISQRMLPRGSYVEFEAEDTFAPLTDTATEEDDSQRAVDAGAAAPAQMPTPLTAVTAGGGR